MKNLTLDPLTGAYFRDTLPSYLEHFRRESKLTSHPFSLVMIDLDHFKRLNDAFGHARGDQVLKHFVERTATAIREEDLLFRYGGDEFLLLLPATGRRDAVVIAERIARRVQGTPFSGQPPLSLTLSMGVASYPDDALSGDDLFDRADARLYLSKRRGRNCITSGDADPGAALILDEDTRLLDRDEALARSRDFLRDLEGRSLLEVGGPAGAGYSRFLAELRKLAGLQGFITLGLVGEAALARRQLGALAHARLDERRLGDPTRSGLLHEVRRGIEAGRSGLLITLEGGVQLDSGSRQVVRELFEALPRVAIAQALPLGGPPLFPERARERIVLEPLSPSSVAVWLQSQLQSAVPEDFGAWFAAVTGGLPSRMKSGLLALRERGVLAPGDGGWVAEGYRDLDPGELLGQNPPPCVLPSWEAPLVGRHDELELLASRLRDERLVTLTGPGGVGKSRLAGQAAHEALHGFRDGVFFVPLAELARPQAIPAAILGTMEVPIGDAADAFEALAHHLEGRRVLLLLDTFEHLLEGAHLIEVLLARAPDLHVLVTSREPLRLGREWAFGLGGLTRPLDAGEGADPPGQAQLERYDAVQLFATGAARAGAPLELAGPPLAAVLRICELTDGLPLALELAAAWTPVLSPEQIADELGRDLGFLEDAPGQGGRLSRVLGYFWSLLSESEQEVLGALAALPGGFGQTTARVVAGASLFFLLALRDRHLVSLDRGRYRMHELLRQYALEAVPDERAARWRNALVRYYARLAERLEERTVPDPTDLFEQLDSEFANLAEAWRLALAAGHERTLVQLARLLRRFLDVRGRSEEGVELFASAEARLVGRGNLREALGRSLEALALFHYHRHQLEEAEASALRSLDALYDHPDGRATALDTLGMIIAERGDPATAKEHFTAALELHQAHGDAHGAARALGNLANVSAKLGETDEARAAYQRCLSLNRELGNRSSLAMTLISYGSMLADTGAADAADAAFTEALDLGEEVGHQLATVVALMGLARVARLRGDHDSAIDALGRALAYASATRNPAQQAAAHLDLARSRRALGDNAAARTHLSEALSLAWANGLGELTSGALQLFADLFVAEGRLTQAAEIAAALGRRELPQAVRDQLDRLLAHLESVGGADLDEAFRRGLALPPGELVQRAVATPDPVR